VGSGTNPICPAPPAGYPPYSATQMQTDRAHGEILSARLGDGDDDDAIVSSSDSTALAKRGTCSTTFPKKRGFLDLSVSEAAFAKRSNGTTNGLVRRTTPSRVDPRGTFHYIVKNQELTGTCASHAFTTMMEGSMMKQFGRGTPKQLSVTWTARCGAGILSQERGASWDEVYDKVKNNYQATETCMPWNLFASTRREQCKVCGSSAITRPVRALTQVYRRTLAVRGSTENCRTSHSRWITDPPCHKPY
jgi:hypothetical protein